jgi:hypothetical protein
MADLAVTIGGRPAAYRAETLSISGSLGTRTTATFSTVDHPPFDDVVEVGQVVEIRDETTAIIFAGTVDSVDEEIDPGERVRFKRLACVDYNQIADRHLVAYVYQPDEDNPAVYAGDVIRDIVSRFFVFGGVTEGIDTSAVENGPAIEKFVFNYVPASQAFDEIAELAGYIWYIDYAKRLHFTPKDRNTAPFAIGDDTQNWRNLKISESRDLYRNRQIVRAGTALTDERTDTVIATEADQKLFEVSYPIGTASAVTVNGVAKTLGVNGLHEGRDYYWSYGSNVLTAEVAPGAGARVALTYQGLFPILVDERIDAEILARRALEGGTGVYEAIADDPAINVQTVAVQKALAYLRKHGVIPQTIRFETDRPGLRPGQLLPVRVATAGLDDNYLIESVNMRDVQGAVNRYQVTAVSGDALGGWLEWFSALARQAQKFVLYDEDQVMMLKIVTETVRVSDSAAEYDRGTVGRKPESRVGLARADFAETDWVHA